MDNSKKLRRINECFYHLIIDLHEEKFDFCAFVIEEAYRFYMSELEGRFVYPKGFYDEKN